MLESELVMRGYQLIVENLTPGWSLFVNLTLYLCVYVAIGGLDNLTIRDTSKSF